MGNSHDRGDTQKGGQGALTQPKSNDGIPTGRTIYLGGHAGRHNNLQCSSQAGQVRCANKNREEWEALIIKHVGNQEFVITSERNGNNLQCRPNGTVAFSNRNELLWERWTIEIQGQNSHTS